MSTANAVAPVLVNQRTLSKALSLDEPFLIRLQRENPDFPVIILEGTRRRRYCVPKVVAWLEQKFGPQQPVKRKRGRPRKTDTDRDARSVG